MGVWSNFLTSIGFLKKKVNLLCIGLDNSGKSTILQYLKAENVDFLNHQVPTCNFQTLEVVPTVGFSVEFFSKSKLAFTVFDMSGQGKYRNLWKHYYPDTDGIIYVIDSSDKDRICVVKDELSVMLEDRG